MMKLLTNAESIEKLKKLLTIICQNEPFSINITKVAFGCLIIDDTLLAKNAEVK